MGLAKTVADKLKDAEAIILEKNKEILLQRKTIAQLSKSDETARTVRENIYGIAGYDPDPPEWLVKEGVTGHRGTPATIWSDWHYGEVVRKSEVGGVNEFNQEVAARRVKKLVTTTIDLAHNHMGRAKINYPGIVVGLGGDMLGGDIHEELMKTNDRTTQQSIEDLIDLIAGGLDTMATNFGKVF